MTSVKQAVESNRKLKGMHRIPISMTGTVYEVTLHQCGEWICVNLITESYGIEVSSYLCRGQTKAEALNSAIRQLTLR